MSETLSKQAIHITDTEMSIKCPSIAKHNQNQFCGYLWRSALDTEGIIWELRFVTVFVACIS